MGKVPPALGLLSDEFSLSLTQSGAIVSMYASLIALTGLAVGALAPRVGYVVLAVAGIAAGGLGSLIGYFADTFTGLLLARALEGSGWIMAAVSLPPVLTSLGHPSDRSLILGIWGAFVPLGAGTMLFAAPSIQAIGGWRLSWLIAGMISLAAAVVVWYLCKVHRDRLINLSRKSGELNLHDLSKPAVWCLGACFFCYSAQFLAATAFLPTLLVEQNHLELELASRLTALLILVNAVGNVLAGWLLKRGSKRHHLLPLAFLVGGVAISVAYLHGVSLEMRLLGAMIFTLVGGIIPGTLFATAPLLASSPAATGLLIGLMLQSSGVGQWIGPIALPAAIEAAGTWSAGGLLFLTLAITGSLCAAGLRDQPRDSITAGRGVPP